ncbi:hypothetical protein ACFWU5_19370 [Nocardia sp. NPDC058640]|uniref:hypothetical protein n=1 Tax=Nocardia sp. NPDC058640 TaxID=3346571 RepID=UPI00365D81C3
MQYSENRAIVDPWFIQPRGFARRRILSIFAISLLTILTTGISVSMLRSGDPTAVSASKYVILFGISMALALALALRPQSGPFFKRPVRIAKEGEQSLLIVPGSKLYFWLPQAMYLCFAMIFLLASYGFATSEEGVHWPLFIIFAALGSVLVIPLVLAATGELRPEKLVLSADSIVHHGWSSQTTLYWADVNRLHASFNLQPLQRLLNIVGLSSAQWIHRYNRPFYKVSDNPSRPWNKNKMSHPGWIVVECPRLAVDSITLYRFLDFYVANPELRAELGTMSSVERWHSFDNAH